MRPPNNVFGRPLLSPQVTATHDGLYATWQVSVPGSANVRSEITRIDEATGKILARRRLGGAIGQVLAATGSLWVATPTTTSRMLVRLNPDSLKLTGRWRLGAAHHQAWGNHVLTVAGGALWVAAGEPAASLLAPGGPQKCLNRPAWSSQLRPVSKCRWDRPHGRGGR